MKWMQWIGNWIAGTKKSSDSVSIGLRAVLSGGAPGGWASDHREETAHNTGFNYIAIHAIAAQISGATVTVFADGDQQTVRQSRRKSLAARAGSFVRWKSTYGADDRETDPLPASHPLVRLLKRPNRYESGANFRYRQAQQIRLTGTCLIWNVPSMSGPTCERYVIPTAMATPVFPTSELPCGGWRINPVASRYTPIVDGGYVDCPSWYRILGQIIDARQVQVIRLPHAWYLDDGQSPLSAGAKWVDAGEAVDMARYHQLKNGVDPSVVWNLPPDVSPDQDEIDRVQAKISAKYGGPENVGRVMVAQSGTSITPLSNSPKDMCYAEGFQDFKAAVLALHQTPPVAVGLQEPGAYAAYNASMKAWRHAAVQPLCDLLAESDTEHLAPQFGVGLTVEIESDTVDDAQLMELQLQNDLAAKVRTKNEWRAVRGMPPLPSPQGDELVGMDANPSPDRTGSASSALMDSEHGDKPERKSRSQMEQHTSVLSATASPTGDLENDSSNNADFHSNQGSTNDSFQSQSDGDANDKLQRRAELIAEILYGIYGSSAFSLIESVPDPSQKAFDPSLHPRDERGRFVSRSSPEELEKARQLISNVLSGRVTYVQSHPGVIDALSRLSTRQLQSVHEEHGIVPPQKRSQLIESVHARLMQIPEMNQRWHGRPPKVGNVDVYIQHPDEVNEALKLKMTHEQWGTLLGAQPGAQVHIFKRGFGTVEGVVIHHDYRARFRVTSTSIHIDSFYVSPKKRGHGIGARVLSQQVNAAVEHKLKSITLDALGEGRKLGGAEANSETGFYAWARFGFQGQIKELMQNRLRHGTEEEKLAAEDFCKRFPNVKDVSEMMLTEERRDWWWKYGGDFQGRFGLQKDDTSRRVLQEYLEEKRRERTQKSVDGESQSDQQLHKGTVQSDESDLDQRTPELAIPDTLTADDERILDRIWNQIGIEILGESNKEPAHGADSERP